MEQKDYNYSPRLQRKTRFKRTRSILGHPALPVIIIILILAGIFYHFYSLNQRVIVEARYGQIVDGFNTGALIIRDEKVVQSPYSGRVMLKKNEGERIGYGQEVISVDGKPIYNHQAGILSYATDGLENRLTPSMIKDVSLEDYDKYKRDFKQLVSGDFIQTGNSLFRIVNNYDLYLLVRMTAAEAKRYRSNEIIFISQENIGDKLVEGNIILRKIEGEQALIGVKLRRFIPEWLNQRHLKVKFIKNIYRGIVIPRKAVFTQPRGEGVLVITNSGDYVFKEIKVLDGTDKSVVVSGLEVGDSVIANPAAYNYGKGRL